LGGGNSTLTAGSDNPLGVSLLPGESFQWTITAQAGNQWHVLSDVSFFSLMGFSVDELGVRTGDFVLSLLRQGLPVFSYGEASAVNSFAHVGTNSVELPAGLQFDGMQLSYTLSSAFDHPWFGGDASNPQTITTTLNSQLPAFGPPELDPNQPNAIVYTAVVPEPSSWLLVLSSLLIIALVLRHRNSRRVVNVGREEHNSHNGGEPHPGYERLGQRRHPLGVASLLLAALSLTACGDISHSDTTEGETPIRMHIVAEADTLAFGSSMKLRAVLKSPRGEVTPKQLAWNSDRPSVISVDSTGVITGLAAGGRAVISARIDGHYASYEFHVAAAGWRSAVVDFATDCANSAPLSAGAAASGYASCDVGLLREQSRPVNATRSRIAVVLVHGFDGSVSNAHEYYVAQGLALQKAPSSFACTQPYILNCEYVPSFVAFPALPGHVYFRNLITALNSQRGFDNLRLFTYTYPSPRFVRENARDLSQQLQAVLAQDPSLSGFVLVGHSMGGLVARQASYFIESNGASQAVRGIITLATLHLGTPLSGTTLSQIVSSGVQTNGGLDLQIPWPRVEHAPLIAYGGVITGALVNPIYAFGRAELCNTPPLSNCQNDGAVPLYSALPASFNSPGVLLRGPYFEYDHTMMKEGRVSPFYTDPLWTDLSEDINLLVKRAGAVTLRFVQQPMDVAAGSVSSPATSVEVLDGMGRRVTGTTLQLSLSFGANPSTATALGTVASTVNGVATFTGLKYDKPGDGFTLKAKLIGLEVESHSFNVTGIAVPLTGGISGRVYSPQGVAMDGAVVTVGAVSTTVGTQGYYSLSNIPVGSSGATLPVSASGLPVGCTAPSMKYVAVLPGKVTATDISVTCSFWRAGTDMSVSRQWPAAVAANGRLYVFGGFANYSQLDLLSSESYDPASPGWVPRANMLAKRYAGHGAAVVGNKIYLAGGFSYPAVPQDNVYAYDVNADSWLEMQSKMKVAGGCGGMAAVGVPAKLYAFTGCTSGTTYVSLMQRYDPASDNWTLGTANTTLHTYPAVVALNGEVYVIGGIASYPDIATKTVDVYNPATDRWRQAPAMNVARYGATAQVINGKIYVVGGRSGSNTPLASAEVFDPSKGIAGSWAVTSSMLTARADPASAAIGGQLYVVGGSNGGLTYFKSLEVFKP
jgi:N-acetylneuraminic acid mutarotase/pimeloyl-ACP methyl ester carboxylesterase